MKLNHNCVRMLLLFLEDNLSLTNQAVLNGVVIDKYTSDEIVYAGIKLSEAGYIDAHINQYAYGDTPKVVVEQITWEGHKFLDNIRDDTVWGHTMKVVSKFSLTSIAFVSNIASQVLTNLITQYMNGVIN